MDFFNADSYIKILKFFLQSRGRGGIGKLALGISIHPTQLSQVLSGHKELTLEQAYAVCEYFEFTEIEARYFILLVERDRSGTHGLKKHFNIEIERIRKDSLQISLRLKEHRNLTDEEKSIFYSSWIYSAIRIFCSVKPEATLEEIAAYFEIDRIKCSEIMTFLVSTNLCSVRNSGYVVGTQHTHVPAKSPHAIKHHINWRIRSLQKQDNVMDTELAFTAPMSLSEKDFNVIREKLVATVKDCIEVAKDSKSERLAFLTIDWMEI